MQKLSEIKKVWVWNGEGSNPKKWRAYPLYADNTSAGIFCVSSGEEQGFEDAMCISDTTYWERWEPIKEPEKLKQESCPMCENGKQYPGPGVEVDCPNCGGSNG